MPHPFAIPPMRRPQSMFSLRTRSTSPDRHKTPDRGKREPIAAPPPVPPMPSVIPLGRLVPNRPLTQYPCSRVNSSGHYVKHSSKLTLLLSGQREGACEPAYSNGDTIEGILAIARPSGVLAVDVKVEGTIKIEEIGGGGSSTVKTIDEKIYCWMASSHGLFPPRASFRYALPTTYRDPASEKEYPLPPTFDEDLHGIPGFRVEVAYAVVVNLSLVREASTLWRGVSNVRVPFRYTHRTRPLLPGPFPCNPRPSLNRPRTLFVFQMTSPRGDAPNVKVHVYLPSSPICCHSEPIPFHVTLLADEMTLEPFGEYRPMPSSFLPLEPSTSNTSCESVQHHLAARKGAHRHKCPLRIEVQRRTVVDSGSLGAALTLAPFFSRRKLEAVRGFREGEESGSSAGSSAALSVSERSYIHRTQPIGHGVVHNVRRSRDSVVWSGAIIIPTTGPGFSGGFEVNGLRVTDSIVLSIDPPSGCRGHYAALNESIPVRLTSDSVKSSVGVPISSD